MRKAYYVGLLAAGISVVGFAAQPIAMISSYSSFDLDGNSVDVAGIGLWPLVLGDRVTARESPVSIMMNDGSRITVAPNSQVQFDATSSGAAVNLSSGSMRYSVTLGSKLKVLASHSPVLGSSGTVSLPSRNTPSSPSSFRALLRPPPPPAPISGR